MLTCVCVCVCERERERERKAKEGERDLERKSLIGYLTVLWIYSRQSETVRSLWK